MGSRIIVPGYFGDKGLGFDPLVRRGLKYLNFYGEADKTGRNLAPDGVAATVLGSPVVQDKSSLNTQSGKAFEYRHRLVFALSTRQIVELSSESVAMKYRLGFCTVLRS
jgi:hypothetical protein